MLKNVILEQKAERDTLLSQEYIERVNLNAARKYLDNDLVKIITGPRRSGKSVFSIQFFQDKNFGYLNFDENILVNITDFNEITEGLRTVYGDIKYVFFDEIQNLNQWELYVNKLHRLGYNLVITGSNSRLLSGEMATAITGRHIPIEILPFCFSEYLVAKKFSYTKEYSFLPDFKGQLLFYFNDYLLNGGFPEIVVKNYEPQSYLGVLTDSILLKDVIKRYKIRFTQKIYNLYRYLVSNNTLLFSYRKIAGILNFNSITTLENYISYLQEAYLVFVLNKYSFKAQERIISPKKSYIVDNGIIRAKASQFSNNSGQLLENIVFIELIRRGYKCDLTLFYYKTQSNKEIDFIIRENNLTTAMIQVAYDVGNIKAKTREAKALIEGSKELNCSNLMVLTYDYKNSEEIEGKTINYIPVWEWMLYYYG